MDRTRKLQEFYAALGTRDHRFDGKFFVGVKTTGIYCRSICPAKPNPNNVELFSNALEAERAGYRPCLRCRPESAPRSPAWIGTSAVVRRAVKTIGDQEAIDLDEETFAERFGVSARHLRRLFIAEIGKTPKQLARENRLNLARTLITETSLALTEVAAGAGFSSVRRFNEAFKARFKRSPSEIRRAPLTRADGLEISLAYRPPFNFAALLGHYESHRIGALEWFSPGQMHRVVAFGKAVGHITVSDDAARSRLRVAISVADTSKIHAIITRVRAMFDLDSDPIIIANALEIDPAFKKMLKKHEGLRLPSGWDPFEVAISTILGQLVSIERGRCLTADLMEMLGTSVTVAGKEVKLFPSPQTIATANLDALKTTRNRKKTLHAFAQAIVSGALSLEPTQDVALFLKKALAIAGVGPWTASYMALKCVRHTDAFPETDLILGRCLARHPKSTIAKMSPWRGYAAALLWKEYAVPQSRRLDFGRAPSQFTGAQSARRERANPVRPEREQR